MQFKVVDKDNISTTKFLALLAVKEGLSVFSEDNEYLFSFITIGTGIHLGNKRVPIDILKKASQILEKDTASLSRA